MNVTMISYYYLPEYSGAAKQMHRLIERLEAFDVKFQVIAAKLDPTWPESEVIGPCRIYRVLDNRQISPIGFWANTGRLMVKLRSQTDIILLNGLKPEHGFAAYFAHLLGIPSIGRLSIANSDIEFSKQGRVIGNLNRLFLSYLSRHIAISSSLRDELRSYNFLEEKCVTIPNGVDTRVFHPPDLNRRIFCRKKLGLADGPSILFVGVIDYRKGVDVLIDALKTLSKNYPRLKAVFVGPRSREDGTSTFYNNIQQKVRHYKLQHNVMFVPYTDDIKEFYHAADLFAFPSRKEGMANVILEAMACGLPVVCTEISGTHDIIETGVEGFLIPTDNSGALVSGIQRLLDDPDLRAEMGSAGARKSTYILDISITVNRYYDLFKEVTMSKK